MFNVGAWEITVILMAALLLLGPQKLPEVARWIGKALRELRGVTQEMRQVIDLELEKQELNELKKEVKTQAAELIDDTSPWEELKVINEELSDAEAMALSQTILSSEDPTKEKSHPNAENSPPIPSETSTVTPEKKEEAPSSTTTREKEKEKEKPQQSEVEE